MQTRKKAALRYSDQLLRAKMCDGWSEYPHEETPVVLVSIHDWHESETLYLCQHCYADLENDVTMQGCYDILARRKNANANQEDSEEPN